MKVDYICDNCGKVETVETTEEREKFPTELIKGKSDKEIKSLIRNSYRFCSDCL